MVAAVFVLFSLLSLATGSYTGYTEAVVRSVLAKVFGGEPGSQEDTVTTVVHKGVTYAVSTKTEEAAEAQSLRREVEGQRKTTSYYPPTIHRQTALHLQPHQPTPHPPQLSLRHKTSTRPAHLGCYRTHLPPSLIAPDKSNPNMPWLSRESRRSPDNRSCT
jgi:hypothetical protein